jgi:hypothetical protein
VLTNDRAISDRFLGKPEVLRIVGFSAATLWREVQAGRFPSMARHCNYTTPKVEEWRSIDLSELRRLRMLDPTRVGKTGRIPALTWKTPERLDQLGVIARPHGVLFIRRDDHGQLGKLFVPFRLVCDWRRQVGLQYRYM